MYITQNPEQAFTRLVALRCLWRTWHWLRCPSRGRLPFELSAGECSQKDRHFVPIVACCNENDPNIGTNELVCRGAMAGRIQKAPAWKTVILASRFNFFLPSLSAACYWLLNCMGFSVASDPKHCFDACYERLGIGWPSYSEKLPNTSWFRQKQQKQTISIYL